MELKQDNELFERVKEFLTDSSRRYCDDVQRCRKDLDFYSGNYSNYIPDQLRLKSRAELQFSELPKYVEAIKSSAQKCPYHNEVEIDKNDDESRQRLSELQGRIDAIENTSNYKATLLKALSSAIITGSGPVYVTTVEGKDGTPEICVESIRDVSCVAFDPNCNCPCMSDAEQGAILLWIGKRKARRKYGDDVLDIDDTDMTFGDQWVRPEDSIPVITYYELVDGGCRVVELVGRYVTADNVLPISRVPVFKVGGYEVFRNEHFTTVGIMDRIKDLQIGCNIAYSTLIGRLARSTKAGFICTAESIDGLEKEIPLLSSGEVPLMLYKEGTTPPQQIHEQFQVSDLQQVIQASNDLISSTIGVPQAGVQGINNLSSTATEALLRQENSESNVACFYDSLQLVSKCIGETICELHGFEKGSVIVKQVNGPNTVTRNAKRRSDLLQLATMVPDNMKPVVAKYYAESLDDTIGTEIADNITANLPAEFKLVGESEDPVALHALQQAKQMIDQQQQSIMELTQQNQQLTKENETLSMSLIDNREARQLDMMKTMLAHEKDVAFKKAELELQSAEAAAKLELDSAKMELEAQKMVADQITANNELIAEITGNPSQAVIEDSNTLMQ